MLGHWEGVILEIQYELFRVLVHFYLKNHARVVKFSYLDFAPLNLFPTNAAKPHSFGDKDLNYIFLFVALRRDNVKTRDNSQT